MDWGALKLSLQLCLWTAGVLIPLAIAIARLIAWRDFRGKRWLEALLALPLVLPPTVLGYYLLLAFGNDSPLGHAWFVLRGHSLAFSFEGLLLAALIFNLPFAVLPIQRSLESIPREIREAAWCSGLGTWQTLWRIELPLAWPGLLSALALTFAHTLGEFGVVLMVGGNIPDETRTLSIAIYDRVQAFDNLAAGQMSAWLLFFSFTAIALVYVLGNRNGTHG